MTSQHFLAPVTADNFVRAESHFYFATAVRQGSFGRFFHRRALAPVEQQTIVRVNRDTLYSTAVFDLDAGPVTVKLPDAGDCFRSMVAINEDQYVGTVVYDAGDHTFSREQIGTRYVLIGVRTLIDPTDADQVRRVHALQDAIEVEQKEAGHFDVPQWDPVSQKKVRLALQTLGDTLPDSRGMFGTHDEVSPVRHLIGAASAWGGNPERHAMYLMVNPARNDGATCYRLSVRDVPVDSFWSISVYNAAGYFEPNPHAAYTLNNLTAQREKDGSICVQFGGYDGKTPNCLPITPDWNYMVRLYRPRPAILDGSWSFPDAQPVN
ncbi:DUF1254 domain-containing protein [Paraburkholderia fungorum]|uniref:DUF1254 domain-containing protein n=1 Tax=Paraburkholderia TaxID=1822464 RepID=UPI0038BD737C